MDSRKLLELLFRGGVAGRGDPYVNEASHLSQSPRIYGGRQQSAPARADPGEPRVVPIPADKPNQGGGGYKPLWKAPTPTPRPDRPNPLQAAVDAAPRINPPQTYAGQERGGPPFYPTISSDQGGPGPFQPPGPILPPLGTPGNWGPTRADPPSQTASAFQQYPTIAEDQGMAPGLMRMMLQMAANMRSGGGGGGGGGGF